MDERIPPYCLTWYDNPKIVRALRILMEYITYWSDDGVQEFHYDKAPVEVLKELYAHLTKDIEPSRYEYLEFWINPKTNEMFMEYKDGEE